ncbi:MAG: glycosyltransferase [Rhodospirillaceae bacterium]|nr:glycosyltransferase [Rhodospirillaceae bacterium]
MAGDGQGLRIMHIHLGSKGGAESFFVRLVTALAEAGVEQTAFTRPKRAWHATIAPVCPFHTSRFSRSALKRPYTRWRVLSVAKRFKPDVILGWMVDGAAWVPQGLPGVKTIVRLGDFPTRAKRMRTCERIVCNTPEIGQWCEVIGWPASRIRVISNFVETTLAEPADRSAHGTPQDAYLVCALGRFVERKGFAYLIEAAARLPDLHVWLFGDGPLKAQFEADIARLGLAGRVRLFGWTFDPTPYIRAADCLCCPSTMEPLGNVILEAWGQQVPVVAAASQGPSWLIEDGVNGFLCPPADGAGLAEAITRLRALPSPQPIVDAASRKLEAEFSKPAVVARYLEMFRS